jgi:hypothetical protein
MLAATAAVPIDGAAGAVSSSLSSSSSAWPSLPSAAGALSAQLKAKALEGGVVGGGVSTDAALKALKEKAMCR